MQPKAFVISHVSTTRIQHPTSRVQCCLSSLQGSQPKGPLAAHTRSVGQCCSYYAVWALQLRSDECAFNAAFLLLAGDIMWYNARSNSLASLCALQGGHGRPCRVTSTRRVVIQATYVQPAARQLVAADVDRRSLLLGVALGVQLIGLPTPQQARAAELPEVTEVGGCKLASFITLIYPSPREESCFILAAYPPLLSALAHTSIIITRVSSGFVVQEKQQVYPGTVQGTTRLIQ